MNIISTARLTLRPLSQADLVSLAAAANNERIARNLARVPWPYDLDDARAFYTRTRTLPPRTASFAMFAVSSDSPVIGIIGYETEGLETELGYWVTEPWWGKGIVSEAAKAVTEHAFVVSRLDRLQGRCVLGNEPSRRTLVGLGFRSIGMGSEYSVIRRCQVVTQIFELTAREWALSQNHR